MEYTKEQEQIINSDINANVCVQSDAGCGKTYCIVERIKFLVKKGINQDKIQVLVFNRNIASEIARKLQECDLYTVNVDTFDSFVLSHVMKFKTTRPLVNIDIRDYELDNNLYEHYISFDKAKEIFLKNNNDIIKKIFLSHMIIDECQDFVETKLFIIKELKKAGIKIFCVGDKKQKINDFAEKVKFCGKNESIWNLFKDDLNLRLTTSFRTHNKILIQTNKIMDTDTTSFINDDNYCIDKIYDANYQSICQYAQNLYKNSNSNNIKILCRKNKDCYEINKNLLNLDKSDETILRINWMIKRIFKKLLKYDETRTSFQWSISYNHQDLKNFQNDLNRNDLFKNYFYDKISNCIKITQRVKVIKKDGSTYNYHPINAFGWRIFNENNMDKNEVRYFLLEEFLRLFYPKKFFPASTIHKAKGMEWPITIVYFTRFRNKRHFDIEDQNLLYVACTRAKNMLVLAVPENKNCPDEFKEYANNVVNHSNPKLSIKEHSGSFISLDAVEEVELNLNLDIHPNSGYGQTLHFIIMKYVHSDFTLEFGEMFNYCDNFVYRNSFNQNKISLKNAFTNIKKLINQKRDDGYEVFSEYKIYLSQPKEGRVNIARIDLLFIKQNNIEIIDIKSCFMDGSELSDSYKRQIELYRHAISKKFKNASIVTKFFMYDMKTGTCKEV